MVTKKVIDTLYSTCNSRPDSPDELNIALLFEALEEHHAIRIDDGDIIINSIPKESPFNRISLSRINDIVEFEDEVAIVLHSSIILLNKADSKAFIHIREEKPSFIDRLRYRFANAD